MADGRAVASSRHDIAPAVAPGEPLVAEAGLPAGRGGTRTAVPDAPGGAEARANSGGGRWARTATACWAGVIVVGFGVGAMLRAAGALPVDPFPPLHAHPRLTAVPLLPALAVGSAAVALLPVATRRLPWRALLAAGWLGSAAWAVALALPDGLSRPLTARTEYLAGLPTIGDHPLRWLRGFTRAMQSYPTHVKGHPPLPTLILWMLERAGLRGPGWAAALVIAAGTSATVAIALTVRALADEGAARRAVPFLVLAPTALWVATSMDAFFLGVGAWAVALATLAARAPRRGPVVAASGPPVLALPSGGRRAVVRGLATGLAGGALLGALPYLSYGLLSFFALPLAALLLARPSRPVVAALAGGLLVVPAAFTLAGFSWWDGVIGTHAAWASGAGSRRPYPYFLVGDLAALALLIGPATARALPPALAAAASLIRLAPPVPASAPAAPPPGVSVPGVSVTGARMTGATATAPRPPGASTEPSGPSVRRSSAFRRGVRHLLGSRLGRFRLDRDDGGPRAGALGWIVAAALAGMAALDLSGVTRGEVERIWIPYAAWVVAANAVHRRKARTLLFVQVVTALVIEAVVRSPW